MRNSWVKSLNFPVDIDWSKQFGESTVTQDNLVRIMCPNLTCQRVLGVPQAARGKLVRCRNCEMTVRVPLPKEAQSRDSGNGASEDVATV